MHWAIRCPMGRSCAWARAVSASKPPGNIDRMENRTWCHIGSEIRRIDAKSGVVLESWPIGKSQGDLAWARVYDRLVGFSPDGR